MFDQVRKSRGALIYRSSGHSQALGTLEMQIGSETINKRLAELAIRLSAQLWFLVVFLVAEVTGTVGPSKSLNFISDRLSLGYKVPLVLKALSMALGSEPITYVIIYTYR